MATHKHTLEIAVRVSVTIGQDGQRQYEASVVADNEDVFHQYHRPPRDWTSMVATNLSTVIEDEVAKFLEDFDTPPEEVEEEIVPDGEFVLDNVIVERHRL